MSKKILLAIVLATFAMGASAEPPFEDVDINSDGMLSIEEAGAVEGLDFDAADIDGDGMLNPQEYANANDEG